MNKRLSFLLILGVAGFAVACDDGNGDTDAGGGDCPPGMICLDGGTVPDGGGMVDAGPGTDSGMMMTGCGSPQPAGQEGGHCRGGTTCLTGLDCAEEISVLPMGGATLTLGNAFGIPTGTEDPAHEGECLTAATPVDSSVPIPFFPNGGLCTQACDPDAEGTCGECTTCSTNLGSSPAFAQVGIGVRSGTSLTSDARPGICQQNCVWNGTDNGGCPAGYACDPGSNICEQACTTDEQCNVNWLLSRAEGLCEVQQGTSTCNTTTGLCSVPGAAGSAFGSECETNAECPADIGICLIGGRCSTYQCNLDDGTGAAAFPCPTDAICVGAGGNGAALCLGLCDTPDDCFPGVACSPTNDLPDGRAGLCSPICGGQDAGGTRDLTQAESDGQCHSNERCLKGRFNDPSFGFCSDYCVPAGGTADPMATACEADELCVAVDGEAYGFCSALDQLCGLRADGTTGCVGDQACAIVGDDSQGRCVGPTTPAPELHSCESTADCTGTGEECVIFDDMDPMTPAFTRGICRAPGGACAPSEQNDAGDLFQPLRGDGSNQCISTQECSSAMPGVLGTCQDR